MAGLFLILLYAGCPVLGVFEQHEQVASSFAKSKVEMAALEALQQYEVTRNGIVFYGSFSIRLWETIARDMAPWPVVKPGFGGAKLLDVIHFAPRILGPHLGVHNPNRCRAVVLFIANDISGNVNEGTTPDIDSQRFSRLLAWIRQQDAMIPVFWIEVTPTESRWDVWPKIQQATKQICRSIDAQAATWFVPTADSFLNSAGCPNSSLFQPDQLHLNPKGYKVWSTLIKSHLEQRLADDFGIQLTLCCGQ